MWLYCLKQLSPELRGRGVGGCFVTAEPAGNAKPHTFRVTDTHTQTYVRAHTTYSVFTAHTKYAFPREGE